MSWGVDKHFHGLLDHHINLLLESLGFSECADETAMILENEKGKYLVLKPGEFGINYGENKLGESQVPREKVWNKLQRYASWADTIFIFVKFAFYHPRQVRNKGRCKKNISKYIKPELWASPSLLQPDWHMGMIVIRGSSCTYYDRLLWGNEKRSRCRFWNSVRCLLKRQIQKVLGLRSLSLSANYFSHSGFTQNICAVPLLYVLNGKINRRNEDPYCTDETLPRYLDMLCSSLDAAGCSDVYSEVQPSST